MSDESQKITAPPFYLHADEKLIESITNKLPTEEELIDSKRLISSAPRLKTKSSRQIPPGRKDDFLFSGRRSCHHYFESRTGTRCRIIGNCPVISDGNRAVLCLSFILHKFSQMA